LINNKYKMCTFDVDDFIFDANAQIDTSRIILYINYISTRSFVPIYSMI